MHHFIIVEEYNGFRFISGSEERLDQALVVRDRRLRHIEATHRQSRKGANGRVYVFRDIGETRAARTRGTYLKSWR